MILKKRVYYLSGFDPRGARFYHRLFRDESKKSAILSGAQISTGKKKTLNKLITQWQIDSVWADQQSSTDYRFMMWDDIMKKYWVSSILLLVLKSIPMYWTHVKCGLFTKFRKVGKGPYICSIYPLVFSATALLLTLIFAFLLYFVTNSFTNNIVISLFLAAIFSFFLMKLSVKLGEKIGVWWILQTYFFISQWGQKPLVELEHRINEFAEQIIQDQIESPAEEILLVGHCVGTIMAIAVIEKIISTNHDVLKNKLSVMTLGQCIPYLSYIPTANHFRTSLQKVVNNCSFPWFDMGARADPLCFQQISPAIADGINVTKQNYPYRVVVKPYVMFSPERYKLLKNDKLKLHFQYLRAAEIKNDYDYFEIVTGPAKKLHQYITNNN
ncbi:MAG TPA: hypothetical protein VES38_11680 [Methylotenera sp.]|nr:hypothetical protein [Methylotenera sp.]